MDNQDRPADANYVELTAEVVSAYVMHNSIQKNDIPGLIEAVHGSLKALGAPKPQPEAERPVPVVPIKKTIAHDYIISLEDGRRYKSLKRHLSGRGLTPEQYREKWGLPGDYPMVAPSYAQQRSELAKSMGLGRQRRKESEEAQEASVKGRRKSAA